LFLTHIVDQFNNQRVEHCEKEKTQFNIPTHIKINL